jgi:hypothetical protein
MHVVRRLQCIARFGIYDHVIGMDSQQYETEAITSTLGVQLKTFPPDSTRVPSETRIFSAFCLWLNHNSINPTVIGQSIKSLT